MSRSFNNATIEGHLTRDPELSYTKDNTAICKFSVACNDSYKKQSGELVEEVSFFNVTCWQKLAATMAKFLKKGSRVLVSGRLKQDRWTDQETQKNRSAVGITAREVVFLSTKKDDAAPTQTGQPQQPPEQSEPLGDDEVPF